MRNAIRYLKRESAQDHPLAYEKLRTNGVDLFVERYGDLVNASRDGQVAISTISRWIMGWRRSSSGTQLVWPPEPFTFFIDRCLGKYDVPSAVSTALLHGETMQIHDDLLAQDTDDEEWLPMVAARGWVVLSKDPAMRHSPLVAEALPRGRRSRLSPCQWANKWDPGRRCARGRAATDPQSCPPLRCYGGWQR